jgi:hypothetical protein
MARSLVIALVALAAAAATAVQAETAFANGRVVRFDRQVAGPYEVALGTIPDSPTLGALHMTLTVADTKTQAYLLDAAVVVEGTGPEPGATIGPFTAEKNLDDPRFYDVNTVVDVEGAWTVTVRVDASLGEAVAEFPIEVRSASPIAGVATLVVLLAFLTILGISLRAYLRERQGRKKRRRAR